ncbi:MAG TPA: hypothetical protein VLU99_01770 [Nitrososphaerales archaeon]|nr:hypothetical protein [Nitrososphaerales archaeon]HUK74491.1 hypothetical protein [Nitrososphaerales archaeon]
MTTSPEAAEKLGAMADLYSRCSELAAQQDRKVADVMGTILPVLAWLGKPVELDPAELGETFSGLRSVSISPGAIVVRTDPQGKVSTTAMAKLGPKDCLALLSKAFPRMEKMVEDKKREGDVRPVLWVKASLEGSRPLLGKRRFQLVVSNSGGDCRDLRVLVLLPGGLTRACKPCDVGRGERVDIDLGIHEEADGAEEVALQIQYRDVDGRESKGDETVKLHGKTMHAALGGQR